MKFTDKNGNPDLSAIIAIGQKGAPKAWPTYLGGQLNRSKYATASEIGGCMRQAYFGKQGKEVPFTQWGSAERGHAVEAWVSEKLGIAADLLYDGNDNSYVEFDLIGKEQRSFTNGFQSGTPDGLVHIGDDTWVLDIKSIDPRTNRKYLPKKKHVDQVQQNIDLVRINTTCHVVGGILYYIDASNFQLANQFTFPVDEERIIQLRERAKRIMTATDPSQLPAEGLYEDGCTYCAFTAQCNGYQEKVAVDDEKLREAERALANVFRQS